MLNRGNKDSNKSQDQLSTGTVLKKKHRKNRNKKSKNRNKKWYTVRIQECIGRKKQTKNLRMDEIRLLFPTTQKLFN